MIRNLLATTAIATLVATGAFAQDATTPAPAPAEPAPMTEGAATAAPEVSGDGHLATQIIGESVFNGTGDDAQNIGDVNDIVLGTDGKIEAVVVGVGGFLGIGEKDVAVDFAQLDWAERDGDRWLVAPMTKGAAGDAGRFRPQRLRARAARSLERSGRFQHDNAACRRRGACTGPDGRGSRRACTGHGGRGSCRACA